MRPTIRKVIASAGGIAVFIGALFWTFGSSGLVADLFSFKIGLASEVGESDAVYKKFADIYANFSFLGLAIASGLSFTLLAWERRPKKIVFEMVYWIFLALALPMTVMNYWSGDVFVSRSQQAGLNLVLCFLGIACVTHLYQTKVESFSGNIIKCFAIFFLSFQAVFLPGIYTVLWWLNWQNAIDLANASSFSPGWISAASGIGALVISILQYKISASKERLDKKTKEPEIIILGRNK